MVLHDPIEGSRTENSVAAREKLERKSTKELFAATLEGEYDEENAWEAVSVLRLRGTVEVFEEATRYCESDNPKARARGLSVLAQLGAGKPEVERPFIASSVTIAVNHLQDSDLETVRCAAWALSHLGTDQSVAALIELRNHSDPEVRQAVACCIELRKHPHAIPILITLMQDDNDVVRDWATFAVGSDDFEDKGVLRYHESPEITAALRKRLEDPYEDARREAIWGLARRKDPLGLRLLLDHLRSDTWWSGDKDTAEELFSAKAETPLEELRQRLAELVAMIQLS